MTTRKDTVLKRLPALAPLQHGVFRSVWTASLASNLGALIQSVAAAWMMTAISDSAQTVALVNAASVLPIMLFSVVSGAIADNFDRRKVMLVAQGFMLAISAVLTVVAYLGAVSPWLLLCFTFLIGCGTALHNPSWQASVGDLVPRSDLPAAVTLNGMSFNLTRSIGPAIGGVIVATAGSVAAFAINAVSYLVLIFALFRWRPARVANTLPREDLGSAIGAGLRYVALSPNIEKLLLRGFVFGFSTIAVAALLPLVTRDILGGGALLYGGLLGAFGTGGVIGGFVSVWLRQNLSTEGIVRLAFVGIGVCATTVALSPMPWLTGPALLIGGACWVAALSLLNVTVQLSTPRWVVGRAVSLYQTATFGGMAIGAWVWGSAAELYGSSVALLASVAVMMAGAAMGVGRLALPDQSALNLDSLNRWQMPRIELDLMPRSGPIKIVIEYVIREGDTREFLDVMAERKRIRRRDGARRWILTRDMEHPDRWVEEYQLPTWIEYVRYNQRMTHADALISEQVRRLHSGSEPPRVRRMIERSTGRYESKPQAKGMPDFDH